MSTELLKSPSSQKANVAGKYLTFKLGSESYGVTVLKVREIIRLQPLTLVPQMPSYIKGVLNLRGKIVPVIDLRRKFDLPEIQNTEHTCIVVVQVALPSETTMIMGVIVDGVEEVVQIAAEEIEPTPDFGAQVDTQYILGMAKIKGAVKILLHIDQVVAGESLELLAQGQSKG